MGDVDCVRFDPIYAEDAAVSRLLFEMGDDARLALTCTLAEFELLVPNSLANVEWGRATIDAFLKEHGLEQSCTPAASKLIDYLRVCRPDHLKELQRAHV